MAKYTEAQLQEMAKPLSHTEQEACKRAIRMVSEALFSLGYMRTSSDIVPLYDGTYSYAVRMRTLFGRHEVTLFVQGSYANNTNVRHNSDVDIAVIQEDRFETEYRDSSSCYPQSNLDYGFSNVEPENPSFKDRVEKALREKFGSDVERKNKSIKVHGNTSRKDADTVPAMRYRDYRNDYSKDRNNYIGGIVIFPDDGGVIINYPELHIQHGRKKNVATNHAYKKIVRVIKTIRYKLKDSKFHGASFVTSFGVESLLWNVPDSVYTKYSSLGFILKEVINYLYEHKEDVSEYKEANGVKPLCASEIDKILYKQFIDEINSNVEYD
ncbi:nucleotidyltransferase [Adlercreutzia sp. ZJ154]|uniref:nucleotidyltransferase domain-containing protein n=1 Tax=Adlercreutzia sp. ZJ154 TaxID=2709790 RepID=UPI0013EC1005|nr:nucleotidyltransferase [Adlercreutzia sp. ZJ154]